MVDWGVLCLLAATVGPIVCYRGLWAATACAAVLQSLPVSCHFRGCKVPLFRIVSGAISSELALPLLFLRYYLISTTVTNGTFIYTDITQDTNDTLLDVYLLKLSSSSPGRDIGQRDFSTGDISLAALLAPCQLDV